MTTSNRPRPGVYESKGILIPSSFALIFRTTASSSIIYTPEYTHLFVDREPYCDKTDSQIKRVVDLRFSSGTNNRFFFS